MIELIELGLMVAFLIIGIVAVRLLLRLGEAMERIEACQGKIWHRIKDAPADFVDLFGRTHDTACQIESLVRDIADHVTNDAHTEARDEHVTVQGYKLPAEWHRHTEVDRVTVRRRDGVFIVPGPQGWMITPHPHLPTYLHYKQYALMRDAVWEVERFAPLPRSEGRHGSEVG